MAKIESEDVRSVALVGHSASGKTMLAEAMMVKGKTRKQLGSITDGSTASDYDEDEKELGYSVDATVLRTSWKGKEVQILDAPGSVDFIGGAIAALSAVEAAVITVCATKGIEVMTRKAYELTEKIKIPRR